MKITKQGIYLLVTTIVTFLLPLLYIFLLQSSQESFDFGVAQTFFYENQTHFVLNYLLLLLLFLFLLAIIGSFIVTSFLSTIVVIGLSFANAQKVLARSTPIYPEDLAMIKELKLLMTMIDQTELIKILFAVALLLLMCVGMFILAKRKIRLNLNKKIIYPLRFLLLILTGTALFIFSNVNESDSYTNKMFKKIGIGFIDWNQPENYRVNGFILAFLNNMKSEAMEEPEGYSKAEILKIVDKYKVQSKKENEKKEDLTDVNIIYIMSESFIDPSNTDQFYSKNVDTIPFTRSILEQYTSGKALVPDYGGGTANMEFEALTSFTNYFLQVIPYQFVVPKFEEFPSIVSYLKDQGYEATAIHPYDRNMYKRVEVYKSLGFDQFLDQTDMKNNTRIVEGGGITDDSAFKEAYDVLAGDEKLHFIHLVTIQNHQPYSAIYPDQDIKVTSGDLTDEIKQRMEIYLQGLRYSDVAMEEFIGKIEDLDKKTIVAFWGDHYPGQGLFSNIDIDGDNSEIIHSTPLFIYSNFESENIELGTQSLNYLTPNVLNQVNARVTPFYSLLGSLNEEIKALTRNTQLNVNGEQFDVFNASDYPTLREYQLIQYDLISGNKYSEKNDFFKVN